MVFTFEPEIVMRTTALLAMLISNAHGSFAAKIKSRDLRQRVIEWKQGFERHDEQQATANLVVHSGIKASPIQEGNTECQNILI